ncbi:MAG: hypothetical protein WCF57_08690 [Pyrinomonadaceae bacterium]
MVKSKDKNIEIERQIMRVTPTLPMVLRRTLRRIEYFDFKQPVTLVEKIKADFAGMPILAEVTGDTGMMLCRLFTEMISREEFRKWYEENIGHLKREAATDCRYSELLRLMGEADARIPFVSVIVSFRHADPVERLSAQCSPVDLLQQAEGARGEGRATAVLRALVETLERVYRYYRITIWQLSFFRAGEMPNAQAPSTGNLVKEVVRRLPDYPNLVEPDAGWMRNSAVHNPREYVVSNDSLVLWDKNVPRTEIRVDDLLVMVQRMYSVSAVTMQRVAQLYLLRNLLLNTGLLDALLDSVHDLISGDHARTEIAEKQLEAKAFEIMAPMQKFFASYWPASQP